MPRKMTTRDTPAFETLTYARDGRIARITLNRPEHLNAISLEMPGEIEAAITHACADDRVHVIVLAGAGRAFCAGYDLVYFAEQAGDKSLTQDMPWDPTKDMRLMGGFTRSFMSIWRAAKPVVCKVHGYAVAGGSDIALCSDLVIMAEDAQIGYPPARVWGCPTTAMWVYKLGAEKAKRMLLTGDLVDGTEAARLGICLEAVPAAELDARVEHWAQRMAGVPRNQLMMQKLMINQAYDNMGLAGTQLIATIFDGITRHSPEGLAFKRRAEAVGFKQAVKERDSGEPLDALWGIDN